MKKLFSVIAVLACLLGFTKNAVAQIVAPVPSISVTRVSGSGADGLPLTIKILKPFGLFTLSQSNTFSSPSATPLTYSFAGGFSNATFSASIGGLTSASNYPLPTAVNTSTTISAATCDLTNYTLQYGYGVTITCTGTNQYTVQATKFYCDPEYPCTPCGGVSLK